MQRAVLIMTLLAALAGPLAAQVPGAWPEVNLANANVVVDRTEIRLYWAGPVMELRRIYNARSHADGPLGMGWRLSYSRKITHPAGAATLDLTEDDGAVSRFVQVKGTQKFDPERCCTGQQIERLPSGQYRRIRDGSTELFDSRGRLLEIRDANNLYIVLTYGPSGVTAITDSVKRSFRVDWSPEGRIHTITEVFPPSTAAARAPRLLAFNQNAQGHLISVTDAMRAETRYTYDAQGRLLTVTQGSLEKASVTYDAARDWVSTLTLPGDRKLAYTWTTEPHGHRVKVTDEAGRVTTHVYENDRLTVTDPEGRVTVNTACARCGGYYESQNAAGGALTHQHPDGTTFVSQDAAGGVERVERDPKTHVVVKRIDRTGAATTFTYDARGNLTRVTDPVANVTQIERDTRGFVSAVVRADQARVELTAGPLGLPEKVVEPAAGATGIEYDAAGLPRRIADASGRALTITYNAADQPLSITDSGGMQREFRYDDAGRVIGEVTGADHHRTTYVYGAPDSGPGEGRLTRVAFGTAAETRFGYDSRGNVTQVARDGNTYLLGYDRASRPVAMTDPVSATVRFDYDPLGNVTRVTDPLGNRTESKYDAAGRLLSRADPMGRTFSFAYDGEGRVRSLKLPGGREVTAVYDASGRLLSVKPTAGSSEAYAYSPLGRIASIDAGGQKTQLTYTAGRVTEATDPVLGKVRYGYTADGRLSEVLSANGRKITISYDDRAHTRKVSTSTDQMIESRLDWEDRRLEETGPGYHFRWSYFEDGYLKDVTDLATQRTHRYRYDGLGHRTLWSDPDGRDTTYSYDAGGRLAKVADRLGANLTFTYDAAGRRVKRDLDAGLVTLYGYDASGRLIDLAHLARDKPVSRETVTYGPTGVIVQLNRDDKSTPVTVDAADRVTGVTASATPTFDGGTVKGEVRSDARPLAYQYDAFTRLVGASLSTGGDVKLGYGPDLRWTAYAGPQGRRELVYETDNVVGEKDDAGALAAEYVMGPGVDEPVAMRREGRLYPIVTDHLGSVIKVLDPTGVAVREVAYSLAGEILSDKGTVPCLFGFSGRPYEPHTGLVNLRLRWLNPRLAAFQTLDPLIPASRFEYANGNPVTFVDPLGAAVDAWLTGDAYAASANLASTGAGPALFASAGAAALSAFAAGPRASVVPGASPLAAGAKARVSPDADALARVMVATAAGRAIGRSLADTSRLAVPGRAAMPGLTSGSAAELLERAAPLPDRSTADRVLVAASARALSRGLFPSAARHVAHRVMDAVWATGPLDAPPLSAAELVQEALAETLTIRVTPVTPPRSPCERLH